MNTLTVDRLQEAAMKLGQQVSVPHISETVVTEAMAILKADKGLLSLLTDDGALFKNVEIVGYPQAVIEEWPFFPADASLPMADAVRDGKPIVLETWEERKIRYPHLADVQTLGGDGAFIAVPVVHPLRRKALGGLGIGFAEARGIHKDECTFLLALADLCAQALDRASLSEALQQAAAQRVHVKEALIQAEEALARSQQQYRLLENNFELALRQHQALITHAHVLHKTVLGREHGLKARVQEAMDWAEGENERIMEEQQHILRAVLTCVTTGKLRLCVSANDLPEPLIPLKGTVALPDAGGIGELLFLTHEAAAAAGLAKEREDDLDIAVGEAALNAVIHGRNGTGHVSVNLTGRVQVRIEDHGMGIYVDPLSGAAHNDRWNSKASPGHGLMMMVNSADRVYLLTGASGTTVVLEQERITPAQ